MCLVAGTFGFASEEGLLCLGPWVGFTFWGTPAQFKDVENHLSLPSSSLGWRLVLRPVFTAVSPWP